MELPSWGGAPKEKVVEAAACQEFVDEATGHRYTWNEAAGESTWLYTYSSASVEGETYYYILLVF